MSPWDGWDVDRAVVAFTAVLFLGMWVQLSLMHWAGGFKHPAMWGPVLATPVVVAAATAAAVTREGPVGWLAAAAFALAVVLGLAGLAYHVRGLVAQIGGFSLRNVLSGPPPILPVAYSMLGLLGLGALVWHG